MEFHAIPDDVARGHRSISHDKLRAYARAYLRRRAFSVQAHHAGDIPPREKLRYRDFGNDDARARGTEDCAQYGDLLPRLEFTSNRLDSILYMYQLIKNEKKEKHYVAQ